MIPVIQVEPFVAFTTSSIVGVMCRLRLIALFGALISTHSRISSDLPGLLSFNVTAFTSPDGDCFDYVVVISEICNTMRSGCFFHICDKPSRWWDMLSDHLHAATLFCSGNITCQYAILHVVACPLIFVTVVVL